MEDDDVVPEAHSESTDEEEFDKREFGIFQCLPVDGRLPVDLDSMEIPDTVEEYLLRVRHEANNLPAVTKASHENVHVNDFRESETADSLPEVSRIQDQVEPTKGLPQTFSQEYVDIAQCDPALKPSILWVRTFLTKYSALRRIVVGSLSRTNELSQGMPELIMFSKMSQRHLLSQFESEVEACMKCDGLSRETASRLYAMTLFIDLPCHGDVSALLRMLVRKCASLRARLPRPDDEHLACLNLIIVVCGGFFRQDEELASMWDEDLYT